MESGGSDGYRPSLMVAWAEDHMEESEHTEFAYKTEEVDQ
jgi:hypothetical protein